jgi:hypothetical protein
VPFEPPGAVVRLALDELGSTRSSASQLVVEAADGEKRFLSTAGKGTSEQQINACLRQ